LGISPRDTTEDALAVQFAVLRRMTDAQRGDLGVQMAEDLRTIARDSIRERHPEYDEEQLKLALFRLLLGDELFRRAWPEAPLLSS
jgi:hypothetical protein